VSDLSFCPTQDLIEELMSRETFLGIIIKSINEVKQTNSENFDLSEFDVCYSNMSPAQALGLLDDITKCIVNELRNEE